MSATIETTTDFIRWFDQIGMNDVGIVGGKNASLGEMVRELRPRGIRIPNGFATTADAYRMFLQESGLDERIPQKERGSLADVAVRSSATAEDLPDASFAGQQETYLNVRGLASLLDACHRCYASLFTDRAKKPTR